MNLQPRDRHKHGLTGFANAFVAVLAIPTAVWLGIDGQWGPAVVLVVVAPFTAYEAVMKYKAGNWF
jgi:hypothetical protein